MTNKKIAKKIESVIGHETKSIGKSIQIISWCLDVTIW